ncbi:chlorophyll(ide) b reductase [Gammaproteobacteria bacterium]|nr:SDR family oxidoreductase [Gammaproteobacteria bacterium]QOJ32277.1 MAG: SDR family oxidoreductase [Gammaproteobacteria bacterium]CAG0941489.1 chlorophyll(ide) b reductase [Gammaproteobacteria bacterium]
MNIVITGSTRGIGLGMAREFLRRGHAVTVSSRGREAVDAAVARLTGEFPQARVAGHPCDVAEYAQVEALWDAAAAAHGRVDIWVNNAGRDGSKAPFLTLAPEDFRATVMTNVLGLMNCSRVCVARMVQQQGGWIWNMEGFGSSGEVRPTLAVYGATKCALRYFTRALVAELRQTPVKVGFLSPGMVLTELLLPRPEQRGAGWQQTRRILNILADTVETVTPFLVEGMLAARESGASVRWLTGSKIRGRFLRSLFVKRDILTPLGY